jgi:nitrogen-specific signal transduction histidine kinase
MSSLQNIYQKMVPTMDPTSAGHLASDSTWTVPARSISREVAHELNNILCIISGYAERMQLKHSDDPALSPDLKVITENARRAAQVVRGAMTRPVPPLPARSAE